MMMVPCLSLLPGDGSAPLHTAETLGMCALEVGGQWIVPWELQHLLLTVVHCYAAAFERSFLMFYVPFHF